MSTSNTSSSTKKVGVGDVAIGGGSPLVLIAGPCVVEDEASALAIASSLKETAASLHIPLIFKASYDKANRTSADSYRGPGVEEGLRILAAVKAEFALPILTDVHSVAEVAAAAEVADCLQIPALLCRQTDLLVAAANTGRAVNIKKGQFMAPQAMSEAAKKVSAAGNSNIILTERGTTFGYNNLVVDMRSLPIMRGTGYPVVFDATHSVQLPSAKGTASGGDCEMVRYLARAAVAVGVDGIFLEVHPDPDRALCDGPNSIALTDVAKLLKELVAVSKAVSEAVSGAAGGSE